LPGPFSFGNGVFAGQGIGQVNGTVALCQIILMEAFHLLQVLPKGFEQGFGQDGDAVLFAFAIPYGDGAIVEVYALDSKSYAFHKAEAAAVEELGHQEVHAGEVAEEGLHFFSGKDGREAFGLPGPEGVDGPGDFPAQDFSVEEEDGLKGLILGGSGYVLVDGQVS